MDSSLAFSPLRRAMEEARAQRAALSAAASAPARPEAPANPFEAAAGKHNVPINVLSAVGEVAGIDDADGLGASLSKMLAEGRSVPDAVAAIAPGASIDAVRQRAIQIGEGYGVAAPLPPTPVEAEPRSPIRDIAAPFGVPTEIAKGIGRGVVGAVGAGAKALGYDETAARAEEIAQNPVLAADVRSFRDVDGVGAAARYVTGLLGESAPEMAAVTGAAIGGTAVAGPAGGFGAAIATSSFFNTGRNIARQEQENPEGEVSLSRAVGAGLAQGGLDAIAPGRIASGFFARFLGATAERGGFKVAQEVGGDALIEGATETGQQLIEIGQANPDLLRIILDPQTPEEVSRSEQLIDELAEAAVGGAAAGGAISAGGRALGSAMRAPEAEPAAEHPLGLPAPALITPPPAAGGVEPPVAPPPAGALERALSQGPAPLAPQITPGTEIEIDATNPETGEVLTLPAIFLGEHPDGIRVRNEDGTDALIPREEIEGGLTAVRTPGQIDAPNIMSEVSAPAAEPVAPAAGVEEGAPAAPVPADMGNPMSPPAAGLDPAEVAGSPAAAQPVPGGLAETATPAVPAAEIEPAPVRPAEERLAYVMQQGRTNGWNARLSRERAALEAEIAEMQAGAVVDPAASVQEGAPAPAPSGPLIEPSAAPAAEVAAAPAEVDTAEPAAPAAAEGEPAAAPIIEAEPPAPGATPDTDPAPAPAEAPVEAAPAITVEPIRRKAAIIRTPGMAPLPFELQDRLVELGIPINDDAQAGGWVFPRKHIDQVRAVLGVTGAVPEAQQAALPEASAQEPGATEAPAAVTEPLAEATAGLSAPKPDSPRARREAKAAEPRPAPDYAAEADAKRAAWYAVQDVVKPQGDAVRPDRIRAAVAAGTPASEIAAATALKLSYKDISPSEAISVLHAIDADSPDTETIEGMLRVGKISDTQQGEDFQIAGAAHGTADAVWATVHAIRKGWLKRKGNFLVPTAEFKAWRGTPEPTPPAPRSERIAEIEAAVTAPAAQEIAAAAAEAEPSPTEAQHDAGNHKVGRIKLHGLNISIETAKGNTRPGRDAPLAAHYGRILRTEGNDGDHVDVYVGDAPENDRAFIVDQYDPETGRFDEHKTVLGARNRAEAEAIYDAGFSDGSGPSRRRGVTEMPADEFKGWLADGDLTKPAGPRPNSPRARREAREAAAQDTEGETAPAQPAAPQGEAAGRSDVPAAPAGEAPASPATLPESFSAFTRTIAGPNWAIARPNSNAAREYDVLLTKREMRAMEEEWLARGGNPEHRLAAAPSAPDSPKGRREAKERARILDGIREKRRKFEAESGAPVEARPKADSPRARREAREKARSAYFTPGNVVRAYGGGNDRVIAYSPPDENGRWSVDVQAVERAADGWKAVGEPRRHFTEPSAADLAAGPVEMGTGGDGPEDTPPSGGSSGSPRARREAARAERRANSPRARREALAEAVSERPAGGIAVAATPGTLGARLRVAEAANAELGRMGIRARIDLSVMESMSLPGVVDSAINGLFQVSGDRGLIVLAMDSGHPHATLGHEAVHALRSSALWGRPFGLFTEREWRILERDARADRKRMDLTSNHYPSGQVVEEVIAQRFAAWRDGELDATGAAVQAFEKIARFIEALGNALRGLGYTTADDVRKAMASGEVGARSQGDAASGPPRDDAGRFSKIEEVDEVAAADVAADGSVATPRERFTSADALRHHLTSGALGDHVNRLIDAGRVVLHEDESTLPGAGRASVRETGIPSAASEPIAPFASDAEIKAHPDYRAAKGGDAPAAARLVSDLFPRDRINQARRRFGKDVIYAPVAAVEASGTNQIPNALALYLAEETGASHSTSVLQTNRAFHTGAKAMERLRARAAFAGAIEEGRRYVIVDDVSVMGSTLADMASHIQASGGEVAGVVLFANAGRNATLAAPPAKVRAIKRRFGDAIRQLFNLSPEGLTASEAEYLLNFRDADALGDRATRSDDERRDRLAARGVREDQEGEGPVGPKASRDGGAARGLEENSKSTGSDSLSRPEGSSSGHLGKGTSPSRSIQGLTAPDGTIHLVARNLNSRTAVPVLLHEMFHAGGGALIGSKAWRSTIGRLETILRNQEERRARGEAPSSHEEFWDAALDRVYRAGTRPRDRAEELGAYAIEEYEKAPAGVREAVDRIIGQVKAFVLRRFGAQLGDLTPAQLHALAAGALREAGRWRRRDAAGADGVRYSIAADVEAAAGPSDAQVAKAERGRIGHALTKAMQGEYGLLSLVPGEALFSELGAKIPAAQHFLRIKEEMDAIRNEWHARADELAGEWRELGLRGPENAALMDLMHEATLAGADPSLPFKAMKGEDPAAAAARRDTHAALKAKFDALPEPFRAMFGKVRDAYKALNDEFEKTLIANVEKAMDVGLSRAKRAHAAEMERLRDEGLTGAEAEKARKAADKKLATAKTWGGWSKRAKVAELRVQFETNKGPDPYFPLQRYGDFFVTVRDRESGAVVSFSRFESPKEQADFANEMSANRAYKVEVGTVGETPMRDVVSAGFVADIETILADAGVSDKVLDQIWQRWLETMPDLSLRKARIHRKGTPGFSSDAYRGFGNALFHGSHQLARLKFSTDLADAIELAKLEASKADDPVRAGLVVKEMERRHEFIMNPTGSAWAQWMTSAAFVWQLAASPAAALVNLTQTSIIGIPVLSGYHGGGVGEATTAAANHLGRALRDFAGGTGKTWRDQITVRNNDRLSEDEKAAVEEAYRRALIDASQAHDLAGVSEQGIGNQFRADTRVLGVDLGPVTGILRDSSIRAKWMQRIGFFFHHAERLNREVTFLAAYRMAREKGVEHVPAIEEAGRLTKRVHFDYSSGARPRAIQKNQIAKVALVFRNYQINMLWRLFRDAHQSLKGASPEERKIAMTQLAGITGMMALHAGVTGVWGYALATTIAGLIMGEDDDEVERMLKEGVVDALGPVAGGIILGGAPGYFTGTDLTSRIGMPELWLRGSDRVLEAEESYQNLVGEALGWYYGMGENLVRGASLIAEGKVYRGIETAAPKVVKDLMRAGRFLGEGATTLRGDSLMDTNLGDSFRQALGFTPAGLAARYEKNSRLMNAQTRILDERSDIMGAAWRDVQSGGGLSEDTLGMIADFNARFPQKPIDGKSLKASFRSRQGYSDRNDGGVVLDPRLAPMLHEREKASIYGE